MDESGGRRDAFIQVYSNISIRYRSPQSVSQSFPRLPYQAIDAQLAAPNWDHGMVWEVMACLKVIRLVGRLTDY